MTQTAHYAFRGNEQTHVWQAFQWSSDLGAASWTEILECRAWSNLHVEVKFEVRTSSLRLS